MNRPLAAMAAAMTLTGGAAAQIKDAGAVMEEIADGVYVIIHDNATDQWPHSNVGVVVYDDGVFVIDSNYLPSRAEADIKLIRKVTSRPVRYLATTHWHFDHNNGASAYREAFPNAVVLYERETDKFIQLNTAYWTRYSVRDDGPRMKSAASLAAEIETGRTEDGSALSVAEIDERRGRLRKREAELAELRTVTPIAANFVFDGEMTLQLGDRTIVMRDRGKANSPHDVTFYLPDEKILFAGDIVVQSPLPYTSTTWPLSWVEVLSDIEKEPIEILVPGHGPVMRDLSYVTRLKETFAAVIQRVETMTLEGRPIEAIQAEMEIEDLRAGYAPWTDDVPESDWRLVLGILAERAFRNLRGQG